jgi:hypothetical protein
LIVRDAWGKAKSTFKTLRGFIWAPGKCAYCNGNGKVPPDRIEKVSVDLEYLTAELPSVERYKVINGDGDALKRANDFKELMQDFVQEIEHLYYIENKESSEIAEHLFHTHGQYVYSALERKEIVDYIEKVIKSKLKD